jgi:hypothetical protein
MRLSYLQKLGRGWGILLNLFVVAVNLQLLIGIAFLPCYIFGWIGAADGDVMPQALSIVGIVVMMGYFFFVGPVVLFHLVQYCGLPWGFMRDPMRTDQADRPVASAPAEPARLSGQEAQSPAAHRKVDAQ